MFTSSSATSTWCSGEQLERLGAVAGLGDEVEVVGGSEHGAHAFAEQRVVVGHQHPHPARIGASSRFMSRAPVERGKQTLTRVPPPFGTQIVHRPPTSAARSRIEPRPIPFVDALGEPDAVVLDLERQQVTGADADLHVAGVGVLEHVHQRLLADAVRRDLDRGGERRQGVGPVDPDVHQLAELGGCAP